MCYVSFMTGVPSHSASRRLLSLYKFACGSIVASCLLFQTSAYASEPTDKSNRPAILHAYDIESIQAHIQKFPRASERLEEIDHIISTLDSNIPTSVRIELDLKKLVTLTDIADLQNSAEFAIEIYEKYPNEQFGSREQYADTMAKIIQALAKSRNISTSYKIVQNMREVAYHEPNAYLSYKIDESLLEIYNESFDYYRAINVVLSMLENPEYKKLEHFPKWQEGLFNEAAFLYNRLGKAEEALIYLDYAKEKFENSPQHPTRLLKKKALNYGNRGRAYLLLGQYSQAKENGEKVLEAGRQLEQNYIVALGHRLIGSAAYNLGQYEDAKQSLEAGIALADKHGIASIQRYLYKDYTNTLKKLELYQDVLYWSEKQTALEIKAREASAASRFELHKAEERALARYIEVEQLKRENEIQRENSFKDRRNSNTLKATSALLLILLSILGSLFFTLRKSQKRLIISERKAKFDSLHDALTRLPNRLFMRDYIKQKLISAELDNKGVGFAHIDVDNFKEVNDTFGHSAGDYFLTEIAHRMEKIKGNDKVFSRIGGDEFLVVITGMNTPDLAKTDIPLIMETICAPINYEGITLPVSVSMGVSHYPTSGYTMDELVINADLALYKAKQDGRSCIRTYDPKMRRPLPPESPGVRIDYSA